MRKRDYIISRKALSDLEEIWLYTLEKWSIEQADRYYNLIIDEIENISKSTNAGKSMEHIRKGYRASKVKSHLIFYRISNEELIEVIRILHEQMDIENRLND
jgi:toxin ParE1/3/4